MEDIKILTKYLFPVMLQIIIIALIAVVLRKKRIMIGYESVKGMVLIVLAGVSSALWGILYQCKYNHKNFLEIIKDFFNVRQSVMAYLLVVLFLLVIFGETIICKGFQIKSMWIPVLLFLKALVFGGIEEIGWRYTFQPVMEKMVSYIPAVLITFICWGIWHFLFFYIDGSLWICVMTHALINALSQIAVDKNVMVGIILKMVCIVLAVVLYFMATKQKA